MQVFERGTAFITSVTGLSTYVDMLCRPKVVGWGDEEECGLGCSCEDGVHVGGMEIVVRSKP